MLLLALMAAMFVLYYTASKSVQNHKVTSPVIQAKVFGDGSNFVLKMFCMKLQKCQNENEKQTVRNKILGLVPFVHLWDKGGIKCFCQMSLL